MKAIRADHLSECFERRMSDQSSGACVAAAPAGSGKRFSSGTSLLSPLVYPLRCSFVRVDACIVVRAEVDKSCMASYSKKATGTSSRDRSSWGCSAAAVRSFRALQSNREAYRADSKRHSGMLGLLQIFVDGPGAVLERSGSRSCESHDGFSSSLEESLSPPENQACLDCEDVFRARSCLGMLHLRLLGDGGYF